MKRPWVITDDNGADAIAIRSMMNLTLTYDHRLVDGAFAGRFLRDLRERLQGWGETRLLTCRASGSCRCGRTRTPRLRSTGSCGAFGFTEDRAVRHTDSNGVVTHAEIELDGARVMLATPNAEYRSPRHHRESV